MRDVKQETITDTLSLFKILPLNGCNPIRVKQRLHRGAKEFVKVLGRKKQKLFIRKIHLEFGKSCEDLSWNHRTSKLHRSETNGIAERSARRVKEGTSAVLLQSRLDERWWVGSMDCCCYLGSVPAFLADGKTHYERRFGEPLEGPLIRTNNSL